MVANPEDYSLEEKQELLKQDYYGCGVLSEAKRTTLNVTILEEIGEEDPLAAANEFYKMDLPLRAAEFFEKGNQPYMAYMVLKKAELHEEATSLYERVRDDPGIHRGGYFANMAEAEGNHRWVAGYRFHNGRYSEAREHAIKAGLLDIALECSEALQDYAKCAELAEQLDFVEKAQSYRDLEKFLTDHRR
jgi:hypothetical protein